MSLPFHLSCSLPGVGLYELDDGRFQLIQPGPIAPLMAGYRYLLVERPLADWLAALEVERIRFESAVLFNRGTGEELRTHVRVHVAQYFAADEIRDLNLSGLRMLTMGDAHYFVSPDLRLLLQRSPFTYLRFTEGLEGFASSGH